MFKLPAGNETTFEALQHNGALDTDSWERRERHNIARLKAGQETLGRNDGGLSPFPSFVLFGRLDPRRMASPMPSIAANSNKQECWLFLTVQKCRREGGFLVFRADGLCVVCHYSSASLETTALSTPRAHRPSAVHHLLRYSTANDFNFRLIYYLIRFGVYLPSGKKLGIHPGQVAHSFLEVI